MGTFLRALLACSATSIPRGALNVGVIACGDGVQACRWAVRGHQVYAAEADRDLLALARRRARSAALDVMFDLAAGVALPWPDRSMDVCVAPATLEQDLLAEMLRVLRPGGALYLNSGKLAFRRHATDCYPTETEIRYCSDPTV